MVLLRHHPTSKAHNMTTTTDKVSRRKLSLLELASELDNVSKACKVMGYSRQQFYEIRRNFQTYGADGLIDRLPGPRGPHPNRVAPEIEKAILDHAIDHPCHGATRVEQELRLKGIQVSSGGVRGVWQRNNLMTKHERLLRLEKTTAERKIELSDEQIRLLERFSPEFRERHIEAPHSGALVAVDTFFVGVLKGVGKIYLQTAIDCHSRYAWARLYPSKLPITAVHLMNNDVIPTFRASVGKVPDVLWPRILRSAGPPPLRAVPPVGGHQASHNQGEAAAIQRHRRALPPHAARRTLPDRRAEDLVRND
jgi:hypothetical protein